MTRRIFFFFFVATGRLPLPALDDRSGDADLNPYTNLWVAHRKCDPGSQRYHDLVSLYAQARTNESVKSVRETMIVLNALLITYVYVNLFVARTMSYGHEILSREKFFTRFYTAGVHCSISLLASLPFSFVRTMEISTSGNKYNPRCPRRDKANPPLKSSSSDHRSIDSPFPSGSRIALC